MSDVEAMGTLATLAVVEPPPTPIGGLWSFYSVRFGGGGSIVLGELPLGAVSITERLGGTGDLTSSVPIWDPVLMANPAMLDVESVLVVAERDGVVQFAGPLMDGPMGQESGDTAGITALGGWQIVRDRVIRSAVGMTYGVLAAGEVRFTQVDHVNIVEDLIAHLSAVREDVPITVDAAGVGERLRDRPYEADKGKSIGEAIEQLALVEHGFEWLFVPSGTADDLTFRLVLRSRVGRQTSFRFDLAASPDAGGYRVAGSSNVLSAAVGRTSSNRVSRFTAVGPGEGASQLVAHATDTVVGDRLRMIERAESWPDVSRMPTLQGHADYGLAIDSRAAVTVAITAEPKAEPTLGAVGLGDIVGCRIDKGVEQFDGDARIVTRRINISEDGAETVSYELAPVGRFA